MDRRRFLGGMTVLGASYACGGNNPTSPSSEAQPGNGGNGNPSGANVPKINPYTFLAHYCTWLKNNGKENNWSDTSQRPTSPYENGYDSLDKAAINYNCDLLRKNTITPMLSWWGPKGTPIDSAGDTFLDAWLTSDNPVPAGILYEAADDDGVRLPRDNSGRIDFDKSDVSKMFISEMNHLHENYFSKHPEKFWKQDGKPVVFLWVSHIFRGRFDLASESLREKIYFVSGDWRLFEPGTLSPNNPRFDLDDTLRGVDALTGYGLYERQFADGCGGEMNECYRGKVFESAKLWREYMAAKHPGKPIWLPMQFNFNDWNARPNKINPILKSTPDQAQALCTLWKGIVDDAAKVGGNEKKIFHCTSWNEMFEGTAIAPSVQYGNTYLNIVKETFKDGI